MVEGDELGGQYPSIHGDRSDAGLQGCIVFGFFVEGDPEYMIAGDPDLVHHPHRRQQYGLSAKAVTRADGFHLLEGIGGHGHLSCHTYPERLLDALHRPGWEGFEGDTLNRWACSALSQPSSSLRPSRWRSDRKSTSRNSRPTAISRL